MSGPMLGMWDPEKMTPDDVEMLGWLSVLVVLQGKGGMKTVKSS